jgi:hypothetical protein
MFLRDSTPQQLRGMLSKLTFNPMQRITDLQKTSLTFRASYTSSAIFMPIEDPVGLTYASFVRSYLKVPFWVMFQSQLAYSVMKLRSLKRMERSFRRGNRESSKGHDIEEKWMMRKA